MAKWGPVPDTWRVGDLVKYENPARRWRITYIYKAAGLIDLVAGDYRHVGLAWKQTMPCRLLNLSEAARRGVETRKRRAGPATPVWSFQKTVLHKDVAEWLYALELTGAIKDRTAFVNQMLRRELDKLKTKKGI